VPVVAPETTRTVPDRMLAASAVIVTVSWLGPTTVGVRELPFQMTDDHSRSSCRSPLP
jgi:hypothetical protein